MTIGSLMQQGCSVRADVERDGHPFGTGRTVREVPNELLLGSSGCGVQGVGG